jgi:metal-dependent amidase/aminoacylase/carboxypeptidase family protein
MCGHDGHVAALVGLATILNNSSFKQMIPSNVGVRLVFQPAEEYIGGAEPMIKLANCLEDVDEVYGWHNWPLVDLGTVLLKDGTVMAHETEFYITVKGQGGHASAPDKCIDPLVCACHIVTNLQTIVSRFLPSNTNSVISVTQFHGGPLNLDCTLRGQTDDQTDLMQTLIKESATNVISDCCYLAGTIRDCDRETTFLDIVKHMERIVKSVSEAHQCTGELEVVEQYMETRNTKDCVEIVRGCINESSFTNTRNSLDNGNMFPTNIKRVTSDGLPLMGSEDFAYYLKERPGCFIIVGTKEEYFTNLTRFRFDLPKAKADINSCKAISEQHSTSSDLENDCTNRNDALSKDNIELVNKREEKCSLNTEDEKELQQLTEKHKRTNCCAHGSTFDFNDNVLPSVISLFLNIASERLISIEPNRQFFKESIHVSEEGVFMQNE